MRRYSRVIAAGLLTLVNIAFFQNCAPMTASQTQGLNSASSSGASSSSGTIGSTATPQPASTPPSSSQTPTPTPTPTPSSASTATPTPVPSPPLGGSGPNQTGTRVAVGPQASIACPSGAVMIANNENIQNVINAHAAGTSYCLQGTFSKQTVQPKTGDTLTCSFSALLDGGGTTAKAFVGSASNVTIQNCLIRNYNPSFQQGVVDFRNNGGTKTILKNNEIGPNASGAGIEVQDGSQVIANYIHDNDNEGYACGGANVVFTDNHISFNNQKGTIGWGNEGGTGKAWATTDMIFSYNEVDHNGGPGPWWDTLNQGFIVQYNYIHDNYAGGIFIEVSYDGVIANNYLANDALMTGNPNNGCQGGWLWCSEIQIASSGGKPGSGKVLAVHDNTIIANGDSNHRGNGIGLLRQNRSDCDSSGTPCDNKNDNIYNNTLTLSNGAGVGAVVDNGENIFQSSYNNFFRGNRYLTSGHCGDSIFNWSSGIASYAGFTNLGQEVGGSCQ